MNASRPLFSLNWMTIISVGITVFMACQSADGATTGNEPPCSQAKLQSEACIAQAYKAVVLPAARVGKAYRPRHVVQGGQPPYEMKVADAQFAATGLVFSREGMLMGIPKVSGKFKFTLTTLDASGVSATQRFVLEILPAK